MEGWELVRAGTVWDLGAANNRARTWKQLQTVLRIMDTPFCFNVCVWLILEN